MSADVCYKHQQEDTPENPCRDCIIESLKQKEEKTDPGDDETTVPDPLMRLPPEPPQYGLFHDEQDTGVTAPSHHAALDAGVDLMKKNPEWKFVEVRDLGTKQKAGGVWRNPKEGRLIRSKELG